jgi:hypothetical protein
LQRLTGFGVLGHYASLPLKDAGLRRSARINGQDKKRKKERPHQRALETAPGVK